MSSVVVLAFYLLRVKAAHDVYQCQIAVSGGTRGANYHFVHHKKRPFHVCPGK